MTDLPLDPSLTAILREWANGKVDPELTLNFFPDEREFWTFSQAQNFVSGFVSMIDTIKKKYLLPNLSRGLGFHIRIPPEAPPIIIVLEKPLSSHDEPILSILQESLAPYGGRIKTEVSPDKYRQALIHPFDGQSQDPSPRSL